MTPQTLFNDITEDACDPLDIVLLVVGALNQSSYSFSNGTDHAASSDEAHRATGNYAYSTVVRYLTAKNPHFRLLALTATPGADAEAVQMVCDNLHISHIEIRDETALDLREYVHEKVCKSPTAFLVIKLDVGPQIETGANYRSDGRRYHGD